MRPDPKVVLFITSLAGGGAERAFVKLAQGLRDYGRRVELVVCRQPDKSMSQIADGIPVKVLQPNSGFYARLAMLRLYPGPKGEIWRPVLSASSVSRSLRCLPALSEHLRIEPPSVVIAAKTWCNLTALLATRRLEERPPVITTERVHLSAYICKSSSAKRRYLAPLVRRLYPHAAAVTAVSAGVAQDLAQLLGWPGDAVRVLPNPVVDDDLFALADGVVELPSAVADHSPCILAVGRLVPEKDFSTLLRGFAVIRQQRDAHLVIIGGGPLDQQLKQEAAALGISEKVFFTGYQVNPYPWMARAQLLVLTSLREGFGNVLIEAMALGTPVVATDCPGGVADVLERDPNCLVPVGDPVALASTIVRMLEMPTTPETLERRVAPYRRASATQVYLDLVDGCL